MLLLQKTDSAYKYIPNAHSKKIYSLDWCSASCGKDILLSSSRDTSVKFWNMSAPDHKQIDKLIEDFPCWKAKFLV